MRRPLLLCALLMAGCSSARSGPAGGPTDGGTQDVGNPFGGDSGFPPADGAVPVDAADGNTPFDANGVDSRTNDSSPPADSSMGMEAGDTGMPGCANPPCLLDDNQNQSTLVIVDQQNIYWGTEGGNGTVMQCPKSGCGANPITLANGVTTTGLAVDATQVYFGDFFGGTLDACAIGGCANSPTILSHEPSIEGVISDGVSLYWGSNANIRTCTLPCDAANPPKTIATAMTSVLDIAVDQGQVFWQDRVAQAIYGCTASACSPTKLAPGAGGNMFATHGNVYFLGTSNVVQACAEGGCNMSPISIGTSDVPENITSDGISVYWRDDVSFDIFKCPASGCSGSMSPLYTNQPEQPDGRMATDGLYLYWATADQVLRGPK